MLRRLVPGNLSSTGSSSFGRKWSRGARRRLYDTKELMLSSNIGFQPLQLTHPMVPQVEKHIDTVRNLPLPLREAQKLLDIDIIEKNKTAQAMAETPIPEQLKLKLQQISDPHMGLREIFTYGRTYELDSAFIEDYLRAHFQRSSLSEIYSLDIDHDSLLKLAKLFTSLKSFDKIAEMYQYLHATQNSLFVTSTNEVVFTTLKSERDLQLGFFNIMKQLYLLDIDIQHFRQTYLFIDQNGSLRNQGIQVSFIELIRSLQLEVVVQSTDNVLRLPNKYYQTDFPFVNASLVNKLIAIGEIQHAFKLLETKLNGVEGMFPNMIDSGVGNRVFEKKLLEYMNSSSPVYTARDAFKWSKLSNTFLQHSLNILKDSSSFPLFLNAYITKTLKDKEVFPVLSKLILTNIDLVNQISESNITEIILKNDDPKLHLPVMSNLERPLRERILDNVIAKVLCQQTGVKQKFEKIKKLLKNVNIGENALISLVSLANDLDAEQVIDLYNRITGLSEEYIIKSFNSLKDKKTRLDLVTALFRKGHFKRSTSFIEFIISSFTENDIIIFLRDVQDQKVRFKFIHPEIISKLLDNHQFESASHIQDIIPQQTSGSLLNDYRLFQQSKDLSSISISDPIEFLRLQVLHRLQSGEVVSFNRLFKDQLKLLLTSPKVNKAQLSEALLTHVVKQLKIRTKFHTVIKTDRLKWCVEICLRNGITKERITEILGSN